MKKKKVVKQGVRKLHVTCGKHPVKCLCGAPVPMPKRTPKDGMPACLKCMKALVLRTNRQSRLIKIWTHIVKTTPVALPSPSPLLTPSVTPSPMAKE